MTPAPDPRRARLQELLGTEATQGLSPAAARELDALLDAFPDEDLDGLELAAAAVHLALAGPPEELPTPVAEKLHLAALAFTPAAAPRRAARGRRAWAAWAVAAGLLGVLLYTNWPKPNAAAEPLARRRDELKQRAPEFVGEKKAAAGSVVWSDAEQVGYLEVKGLPPLDAAAGTYQLWIVDAARKDSPPVDGGVFKVNPDGTALVPVRPPIQVKHAAAFAITKEKDPGGVVVSKVPPEQYELVLTKRG